MRKKTIAIIACLFLAAAVSLPWLTENHWRSDPRLTYNGEIFDPIRTEKYNAEAQAGEDYVHLVTQDGLAVPMMLGNAGVEHRTVHMMVDNQEVVLKFEDNRLVGYTPVFKNDAVASYVFYRDYGTMHDLFIEYCRQGEWLKRE